MAAWNAIAHNRTMAPSPEAGNPLFDSTRQSIILAAGGPKSLGSSPCRAGLVYSGSAALPVTLNLPI
jgi:hypothetical protein